MKRPTVGNGRSFLSKFRGGVKMVVWKNIKIQDDKTAFQYIAELDSGSVLTELKSSILGLHQWQVEEMREAYGENKLTKEESNSKWKDIRKAFINPFTAILIALAIISLIVDVWLAPPTESDATTVIVILVMVLMSGSLRFVQEWKSDKATERLMQLVTTTTRVIRREVGEVELPVDEVVRGDIVCLSAGDMVPADIRLLMTKDLFVSQAALTGESDPVEKISKAWSRTDQGTDTAEGQDNGDGSERESDYNNMVLMGTNVISGSAKGVVVNVGGQTVFGRLAKSLMRPQGPTSFDKGVSSVSWLLIRFMLIMVPVVFFINGYTKGDWIDSLMFALSVAVGLTPEMLPMIVTTCLAKGAVAMSKEKMIIKNLNAIQTLGAMDILCTDKTGTLTKDKVELLYHLNVHGQEDYRVLRHAFLNSYYQTGLKNLMDVAIIERTLGSVSECAELEGLGERYVKVDEIPFDFERRRMSVVVSDGKTQLITKGAVEEMLSICSYVEYEGVVHTLTEELRSYILAKVEELNDKGMRVLAVAQKTNPSPVGDFSVADEADMVLMGYLAFLDPAKDSAVQAIAALNEHGVTVKVLTGDNEKVSHFVCKQVGIPADCIVLGRDIDRLSDAEVRELAQDVHIFAKLSPDQKTRIISCLQDGGHVVGYMGDGINDTGAMKVADVGISVDTAVDIAKESADIILLEKDLMVLERGLIEGRKTYVNMVKYIKMTASSNFGNVLSVLVASAFLPFIPMLPIQLILLNMVYDFCCGSIPWDNVDAELIVKPQQWDASGIGRFMAFFGPSSSLFDLITYGVMYFVICPLAVGGMLYPELSSTAQQELYAAVFQAGWFIESMWTQSMVIHMLRTSKLPFIESIASKSLLITTVLGCFVLSILPFTSMGAILDFSAPDRSYFFWLLGIVSGYIILVSMFKQVYLKKYKALL